MKIVKEDMGYDHPCKTPCGLIGITVQCTHCPYSVVED